MQYAQPPDLLQMVVDALHTQDWRQCWAHCDRLSVLSLVLLFAKARKQSYSGVARIVADGPSGASDLKGKRYKNTAARYRQHLHRLLTDYCNQARPGAPRPSRYNLVFGRFVLPECGMDQMDMTTFEAMTNDPECCALLLLFLVSVATDLHADIRYVKYEILKCLRVAMTQGLVKLSLAWERRLLNHLLDEERDSGVCGRLCPALALLQSGKLVEKFLITHKVKFTSYRKSVESPMNMCPDMPPELPEGWNASTRFAELLIADAENTDNPYVCGGVHLMTPFCSAPGTSFVIRPIITIMERNWTRSQTDPAWKRVALYPYTTLMRVLERQPDGAATGDPLRKDFAALDLLRQYEATITCHEHLQPLVARMRLARVRLGLSA